MKLCINCNTLHKEPTNLVIGICKKFVWFQCGCDSTLVLKIEDVKNVQDIKVTPRVPS